MSLRRPWEGRGGKEAAKRVGGGGPKGREEDMSSRKEGQPWQRRQATPDCPTEVCGDVGPLGTPRRAGAQEGDAASVDKMTRDWEPHKNVRRRELSSVSKMGKTGANLNAAGRFQQRDG